MSELVLIGLIALIIFGPRKLPAIAQKAGKTMSELRKVTGEFKETWQKEVQLEGGEMEVDKSSTVPSTRKQVTSDQIEIPKVSSAPASLPESAGEDDLSEKKAIVPSIGEQTESLNESKEEKQIIGKEDWL